MQKGLVSVIIPTRNRSAYLKQAIDSVYAQTYQNFELVVIDDGSREDNTKVIQPYDKRLKYYRQEHAGASAARNNGISKAQGEYIAFLDDDDIFLPEKLQHNITYMEKHPEAVWLCSGFSFIDVEGKPLPRNAILPEKTEVTLHDIAMFMFIDTSTVMVRRENFTIAGGFEKSRVSEDYYMWARLLQTGKGAALQEVLALWRLHPHNTKLPFHALLRENTRIIDYILKSGASGLALRDTYIRNLHRIIADSLLYKKKYVQYACFRLWQRLFKRI